MFDQPSLPHSTDLKNRTSRSNPCLVPWFSRLYHFLSTGIQSLVLDLERHSQGGLLTIRSKRRSAIEDLLTSTRRQNFNFQADFSDFPCRAGCVHDITVETFYLAGRWCELLISNFFQTIFSHQLKDKSKHQ
jgi:hypothetical protein